MKSFVFGNPNASCWKLGVDDISVREQLIAFKGELHCEFIRASTPMCISPAVLSRFAMEVEDLDKTLTGSATLENRNQQSTVLLKIGVNHIGHLTVTGRYEINSNAVDFAFRSDQTQLAPFAKWLRSVVAEYQNKAG